MPTRRFAPRTDHDALVDRLLTLALDEDVGPGDATTTALIPADARLTAQFTARDAGVLAGLEIVKRLYAKLGDDLTVERLTDCGHAVKPGEALARVSGPGRAVLTGERTALNLLQRMCGVATLTRRYVEAVNGTHAKILDTRKTMPGMRILDKLAVYIGGGTNHREGLYDMILIKDNHLALAGIATVGDAVLRARESGDLPVMVEVDTLEQLREALPAEPDFVLLDNMGPDVLREAVAITHSVCTDGNLRRPQLEASGGVNLQTVRPIAESGVDRISVGALTHSAVALDIGLDYIEE